jgi:hypothetical protein
VVHDNVAEPVFKTAKSDDVQEFTLGKFENVFLELSIELSM